ncbi:MAG: hypothetical protein AABY22_36265 [Nanoarchaeota archaeon]
MDAILTQDDKIDFTDPQFNMAMKIAVEIKDKFGSMISQFKPQISYTAIAEFNGFKMPVTGRLDWEFLPHAVVDLKVTGAKSDDDFKKFIEHLGYKNQLFHYCKMAGAKNGYIFPYSTTAKKCLSVVSIPIGDRNEFWEEKILKFGSV